MIQLLILGLMVIGLAVIMFGLLIVALGSDILKDQDMPWGCPGLTWWCVGWLARSMGATTVVYGAMLTVTGLYVAWHELWKAIQGYV
jgi:hypothetical protein